MNNRDIGNIAERTCAVCGRPFTPAPKHAYKDRNKDDYIVLLCSQSCLSRFREKVTQMAGDGGMLRIGGGEEND